jgi:hypothetical protein
MKNLSNKLPQQQTTSLYGFTKAVGFSETTTTTSGDPTNTTVTVLTTTHIWQK